MNKVMMVASISAIHVANIRMAVAAHNVANVNTENARAQRVRITEQPHLGGIRAEAERTDRRPSLIDELVEDISAKNYMKVNVRTLKVQDEMMGSIIDILA
jgi:flagellar basal body rod protein FlgC